MRFFFVGNARERIYRINFIAETRIAECVTRAAGFAANEWATVQGHELQQIERAPDSPLSFLLSPYFSITN